MVYALNMRPHYFKDGRWGELYRITLHLNPLTSIEAGMELCYYGY